MAGEAYRPAKRYRVAGAGEQDLRNAESEELTRVHAIDAIPPPFCKGPSTVMLQGPSSLQSEGVRRRLSDLHVLIPSADPKV